uniref:Uncharacterized protein n=1 Tax=Aegilops tauschii subsp. strangulata TaxID=200361 RepID=A0A453DJZ9_AEGTS
WLDLFSLCSSHIITMTHTDIFAYLVLTGFALVLITGLCFFRHWFYTCPYHRTLFFQPDVGETLFPRSLRVSFAC